MKKIIYLSTAAFLLAFPGIANASQNIDDLTGSEVFCSNTSADSGNAIKEIKDLIVAPSNSVSMDEREVLIEMKEIVDNKDTVRDICHPEVL